MVVTVGYVALILKKIWPIREGCLLIVSHNLQVVYVRN